MFPFAREDFFVISRVSILEKEEEFHDSHKKGSEEETSLSVFGKTLPPPPPEQDEEILHLGWGDRERQREIITFPVTCLSRHLEQRP